MSDPSDSAVDFGLVFRSTPAPYLILDPAFKIIAVNEAYLEATMTERDEIVGRHIFEVFPDNPDESGPTGVSNLRASLEAVRHELQPDSMAVQKYDIPRPDGSFEVRYWSPRNTPVIDNHGELYAIIHRVEDVTDLMRLEAHEGALKSHVTELEAELYERGQEIQRKKKRIEKAYEQLAKKDEQLRHENRLKDEFLAMLSHELRNPMAAIAMATQVLQSDAEAAARDDALEIVTRQVEHMRRMSDDLLDVSRLMNHQVQMRDEHVPLADIIDDALDAVRDRVKRENQHIELSMPDESVVLRGDSTRLVQVFTNLLDNASKYSPEGSRIWVDVAVEQDEAVVEVRDEGVGIAPDLLPHIFDLFEQADATLDRTQGGLGLGLTIVDRLVDLHGGTVEAYSEGPDRGSRFVVRLPARRSPADLADDDVADGSASPPQRVLLVDDNRDFANSLSLLVEQDGHQVELAYDGETAVASAASFEPDVVLLDIGLPVMDGYEVAGRLRELPQTRDAVIIALSGYGRHEDLQNSRRAGIDHHLVKPVDIAELRRLIGQRRPGRAPR